jgi:hypothetical protein
MVPTAQKIGWVPVPVNVMAKRKFPALTENQILADRPINSKWIVGVALKACVLFPHDVCLLSMYMQCTLNQMDMSYTA